MTDFSGPQAVLDAVRANPCPRTYQRAMEWLWRWQADGLADSIRHTLLTQISKESGHSRERLETILRLSLPDLRRAIKTVSPTDRFLEPCSEPFPTKGWLGAWRLYTQGGEAPAGYNFWSGVATLATALRRHIYWDRGKYYLYLNHYLLILGETGLRKSTSIDACVDLLSRLNELLQGTEELSAHQLFVSPQRITAERLVEKLANFRGMDLGAQQRGQSLIKQLDATGLIVADELVTLLGKEVKGSERMIHFLTAIYGCPKTYSTSTISNKDKILHNVGLSVLFGTTEEWVRTSITEDMFAGGFLARFVVVHRTERAAVVEEAAPLDPVVAQELASWLAPWSVLPYPIELVRSPEASEWYKDWYARHSGDVVDDRMKGFQARKHDHLHKLAGLLKVSELVGPDRDPLEASDDGVIEVDRRYFEQALALLDAELVRLPGAFASIGTSDEARLVEGVWNTIQRLHCANPRSGHISYADLMRSTRASVGNSNRLRWVLMTLQAEGRISVEWGRPAKIRILADINEEKPDGRSDS